MEESNYPSLTLPAPELQYAIYIAGADGELLFGVRYDGVVEIGPKSDPSEAARRFMESFGEVVVSGAYASLGARTVEARKALRDLVQTSLEAQEAFEIYASRPFESDEDCLRANSAEDARKLAVLAYREALTQSTDSEL